jgi:hypothetical protein
MHTRDIWVSKSECDVNVRVLGTIMKLYFKRKTAFKIMIEVLLSDMSLGMFGPFDQLML